MSAIVVVGVAAGQFSASRYLAVVRGRVPASHRAQSDADKACPGATPARTRRPAVRSTNSAIKPLAPIARPPIAPSISVVEMNCRSSPRSGITLLLLFGGDQVGNGSEAEDCVSFDLVRWWYLSHARRGSVAQVRFGFRKQITQVSGWRVESPATSGAWLLGLWRSLGGRQRRTGKPETPSAGAGRTQGMMAPAGASGFALRPSGLAVAGPGRFAFCPRTTGPRGAVPAGSRPDARLLPPPGGANCRCSRPSARSCRRIS